MKRFILLATLIAGSLSAAEPVPYGHADFVPTPDRPLYFRVNNAEYPGATPPAEWWEGTPTQREVSHTDASGKVKKSLLWDFADDKSKNILWKAPVPGWSLSHPIVVGRKVFAVGDPDFVTCWDFDTGKQLWQRRIMPLLCDGLNEEKAAAAQKVIDLAKAMWQVSTRGPTSGAQPGNCFTYGVDERNPLNRPEADVVAARREFATKLIRMLTAHRADVEAFGDAELVAGVDNDLALLRKIEQAKDNSAINDIVAKRRGSHLVQEVTKKFSLDLGGCWWGYVGTADSTLVSDGQRILGVFDQGQVFCLDLDGKLLWGQREKGPHDNRGTFHRSPLLYRDTLLVRGLQNPHKGSQKLRALDVQTGQVRWEVPLRGSNYTVPRLMRLTAPDGKGVDVLVGDAPVSSAEEKGQEVLRASDGKLLGHLPFVPCGRGALMSIWNDVVAFGSTDDGGGGPDAAIRVKMTGPETVTGQVLYQRQKPQPKAWRGGGFPISYGQYRLGSSLKNERGSGLVDTVTGEEIASLAIVPSWYAGGSVAGQRLITILRDPSGDSGEALVGRNRDDRKAITRYAVVDLSDIRKPKVLSDRNLLGYKDPPADIIVRNYLKEFDPYIFAKCYSGTPSYFSLMGGPVPHGNRLLIQSTAYLYCIGEK